MSVDRDALDRVLAAIRSDPELAAQAEAAHPRPLFVAPPELPDPEG